MLGLRRSIQLRLLSASSWWKGRLVNQIAQTRCVVTSNLTRCEHRRRRECDDRLGDALKFEKLSNLSDALRSRIYGVKYRNTVAEAGTTRLTA